MYASQIARHLMPKLDSSGKYLQNKSYEAIGTAYL